MNEQERYNQICQKLGFRLEDYRVPHFETEDDSWESPFRKLDCEELDFIIEYMEAHDIHL